MFHPSRLFQKDVILFKLILQLHILFQLNGFICNQLLYKTLRKRFRVFHSNVCTVVLSTLIMKMREYKYIFVMEKHICEWRITHECNHSAIDVFIDCEFNAEFHHHRAIVHNTEDLDLMEK